MTAFRQATLSRHRLDPARSRQMLISVKVGLLPKSQHISFCLAVINV